jgi:CubicO group peptidase (beta-lactamase class C family)
MNDDRQLDDLLRARPARDARYQAVVAELLDNPGPEHRVAGTVRWRQASPINPRAMALVMVLAAIVLGAVVFAIGGGRRTAPLVVVPPPAAVAPEPVPNFPITDLGAVLGRFQAARWADRPDVIVEVSVSRNDRIWVAAPGENWYTYQSGPVHPGEAMVRVGGVSRLLHVAVTLRLVDEGRLDLDDPISRFVSWPVGDGITIRQLLDGSSGVAAFGDPIEELARVVAAEPDRTWTQADALQLARARSPRFQPGAKHEITDTEDVLLAEIIKVATGSTAWDAMTRMLEPLRPIPQRAAPGEALPRPVIGPAPAMVVGWWDRDGTGDLVQVPDLPDNVIAVLGPGRNWADTVTVLAQGMQLLHTQPVLLSDAARASLDRSDESGGFGGTAMCPCTGNAKDGVGFVGHTGPYTALVVYVPSERMTIAVTANVAVSDDDLHGLVQDIHDLVWPAIR